MKMLAGVDVGGKTTAICVVDEAGKIASRGMADPHPDAISARLKGRRQVRLRACVEWRANLPPAVRGIDATNRCPLVPRANSVNRASIFS